MRSTRHSDPPKPTVQPTAKSSAPTLPTPPTSFDLTALEAAYREYPVWLRGDPTKVDDETGQVDYTSEGQEAFRLRAVRTYDLAAYRALMGESIDTTINKIHWVFTTIGKFREAISKPNAKEEDWKQFEPQMDPVTQEMITPFGNIASVEEAMSSLVAFLLYRGGRVIGEEKDKLIVEDTTLDDVLELLLPNTIVTAQQDDGTALWYKIIEAAQIWQPQAVVQEAAKHGVDMNSDGELGNSPASNSADSRGKGSSTRRKR